MAPMSSLSSHIANQTMHITAAERQRWNAKADASDLDDAEAKAIAEEEAGGRTAASVRELDIAEDLSDLGEMGSMDVESADELGEEEFEAEDAYDAADLNED